MKCDFNSLLHFLQILSACLFFLTCVTLIPVHVCKFCIFCSMCFSFFDHFFVFSTNFHHWLPFSFSGKFDPALGSFGVKKLRSRWEPISVYTFLYTDFRLTLGMYTAHLRYKSSLYRILHKYTCYTTSHVGCIPCPHTMRADFGCMMHKMYTVHIYYT